ncbi:MAG: HEAT repeat domain-containing protein [Rhodospirillales bacterium]
MPYDPPPAFLEGSFVWDRLGYSFAGRPPLDLREPHLLSDADPWIVLAATLVHAKNGDFAPVVRLSRYLTADYSPLLIRACIDLIGNVGDSACIDLLQELLTAPTDWIRTEACSGALLAASLRLVPPMLQVWRRARRSDDRGEVSAVLSRLLEPSCGLIAMHDRLSDYAYEKIVADAADALWSKLPHPGTPVWHGAPFWVPDFARQARNMLRGAAGKYFHVSVEMLSFRQKFESFTGTDCSGFFKDRKLQFLAAAAVIEDFLESGKSTGFVYGQHYFFANAVSRD